MQTGKYKVRAIRLEDKVWNDLFKKWKKSEMSWNLFIKTLLEATK